MRQSKCVWMLVVFLLQSSWLQAEDRKLPNVVVFLADDAGWGDYSRNGNAQVSTPHIDSLARDGVTLDRFFVCPVCAPTRAEFLTGRYHPRTGVYGVSTGQERMNLDEATMADAFRAAGYATGIFGKWHNGSQWPYHPLARGFDEFVGYTSGHWGEYFDPPLEKNGMPIRAKGYIVDVLTDEAIDFIQRHHERPFFCYIPFTTPHTPWAVPEEDWQRWKNRPIHQLGTQAAQEVLAETRCALAMVENQDRNVGRVLARLKELNLADDTIVVYFSDNGPNTWRYNGGMKGRKASTDEGGVRSVSFWRWSNALPSDVSLPDISGAIDMLPTLTTLAGIKPVADKPLDGISLAARMRGSKEPFVPRTIFSTWAGRVSARTQTHRLDDVGRLFDMTADPGQSTPLGDDASEQRDALQKSVAAWLEEMKVSRGDRPKGRNNSVDQRPIPVGFREFPRTWLPARDGEPRGNVKRSSNAPNSSYFVGWSAPEDRIEWLIDLRTAGEYDVELLYTCAEGDEGARIELTFGDAKLSGVVMPAWNPPLYTNQDTLPRPAAESKMKEFRSLKLGSVRLEQGLGALSLRATEIPGNEVMHLRAMVLTLLP